MLWQRRRPVRRSAMHQMWSRPWWLARDPRKWLYRVKSVTVFQGRHRGEDVYVLGAGASLNYMDREYFGGRVVVTVNEVAQTWGIVPSYIVLKEHAESVKLAAQSFPETPLIVSRHAYGDPHRGFPPIDETPLVMLPNLYVFEHGPNRAAAFDVSRDWPANPDEMVVSMSTITSAMHFAAYLGARTIHLVGCEGGKKGDSTHFAGYGQVERSLGYDVAGRDWLRMAEPQSRAVKHALEARYGVRVYTLSPFLDFRLRGVPADA